MKIEWALAAGVFAAASGPAFAAEPSKAATVSELVVTATKMVSELTVTAKLRCLGPEKGVERATRPTLVSSFPARGAEVRPGLLVVRMTFDQAMACAGTVDAAPPLPNPCPGASRQMLLSLDRRTIRTVCEVQAGASYGLSVGQDPNGPTFLGLTGLPAAPSKISFSTSAGPAVVEVCDALSEDPETAAALKRNGKSCAGEGR
jgi:hypothetical protein